MPPQIAFAAIRISEDERSDVASSDGEPLTTVKVENSPKNGEGEPIDEEDRLMVESEKEGTEDDDEEVGEDEYVVEGITNHLVDEETGAIIFQVKWEGYDKKSDRTWEPEDNLETASKVLNEYLASVGGKESILQAWEEAKANRSMKKGKKRSHTSAISENETNGGGKRGRKSGTHPASASPPASVTKASFKPPTGSWEDAVVAIDACEGQEGKVIVYLTWKSGEKTQHPLSAVYKRCPQKMLAFYESHLVFKKNDDDTF